MSGTNNAIGRSAYAIKTPYIRTGDNLIEVVINSIKEAENNSQGAFKLKDRDIIAVTEAVVAISQENYANYSDIAKDIETKFAGTDTIAIVNPIQSRNRFLEVLKAIASTPSLKKIIIALSYPSDEVGNALISRLKIIEAGINETAEVLSKERFVELFGEPKHRFTEVNYLQLYTDECLGKAEVVLCNDFSKLYEMYNCKDYLGCSIHCAEETEAIIRRAEKEGEEPFRIYTMGDILSEPVDGSGYHPEYGLYGTNAMKGERLKLMPRDCDKFVKKLQERIFEEFGVKSECMVYGDGAFKDPVGHIWELADPVTTLAATEGLGGTPEEVKIKYLLSDPKYEGMNQEELNEIIEKALKERKASGNLNTNASLGTTPRQITDLVASLCDLMSGSGNECTPVVVVSGYLK